jgi:hypothetical protein
MTRQDQLADVASLPNIYQATIQVIGRFRVREKEKKERWKYTEVWIFGVDLTLPKKY